MAQQAFTAEFALMAACCRPPRDVERLEAVRDAAARDVDWAHFLRLAYRHRVEPIVLDGLRSAGVELPPEGRPLADRAISGTAYRLALIAETLRLTDLFEAAGIPMLCIKGAPLEMLAYGRVGIKQSRDIDILVDEQDLFRAEDLLAELGYHNVHPGPEASGRIRTDPSQRRAFLRADLETVWQNGKIIVEVHWRLTSSRFLLQGVGVTQSRQSVELLPGRAVPTLAQPELFAYLALHGAYSGWFRLKWLADFVALVTDASEDDLDRWLDRAASLRVGRCAAQALLIGNRLLGLKLPPRLATRLDSDPTVRAMVDFGVRLATAPVPAGSENESPRSRGMMRLRWKSVPQWRYRLELLERCWRDLTAG